MIISLFNSKDTEKQENLDKVDSLKIEFEIDGAMKVFEM